MPIMKYNNSYKWQMPKKVYGGMFMPRRDGNGARTGRGMGLCNGDKDAETLGLGKRGGRRRCGRNCRWNESNKQDITKN